jgi:hypothetical protein
MTRMSSGGWRTFGRRYSSRSVRSLAASLRPARFWDHQPPRYRTGAEASNAGHPVTCWWKP